MATPKVSIIIACYNDPDVIKAVDAARNQTYQNTEIIVVDDGSDRKIKKIIESTKNKVDSIIIQENKGQSIARNRGIREAKGFYILNWDSDDYFEPDFCEKAVAKFESEAEIKIVTSKAKRFNKQGIIDVYTPQGGKIENFLFSNSALGSSMFKKSDWEKVGGYEEILPILGFEDWEFYIQLLKTGGYAFVIPEVLFNYQVRPGSTTFKIRNHKQEKFRYIILKHKELYIKNFDDLVSHLFYKINNAENEVLKSKSSIDFRTGEHLLSPLRKLKSLFK